MKMPSVEKADILEYITANPLRNERWNLVTRALLDDGEAVEEIITILEEPDRERAPDILHALGQVDWKTLPRLYERRGELLFPLLDHPDGKVRTYTAFSLEAQEESFWWEQVKARLLDESYPGKPRLASMMRNSRNLEAIELVRRAMDLRGQEEPAPYLLSLLEFTRRKDREWHERGLETLFEAVEAEKAEECSIVYFNLLTYDVERTMPMVEKYLFYVMENDEIDPKSPPSFYLRVWARHRGRDRQDILRAWTSHEVMGHFALEALAELNAGSKDADLARQLYDSSVRRKYRSGSIHTLAQIGGEEAITLALKLIVNPERFDYEDLVGLRWTMNGITLEKACEIAVRHGLLPEVPDWAALAKTRLMMSPYENPFDTWRAVIAQHGRAASFPLDPDIEARHDELIMKHFGKAGAGLFDPLRAGQALREKDDEFDVAFEQKGRLYRFRVMNRYGSYDVEPVVAAINGALADDGREERFQEISTGGGGYYVLATPENLDKVARELYLATKANMEYAIEDMKTFRTHVAERAAEQGEGRENGAD